MASRAGVSRAVTPPAVRSTRADDDEDGHRRHTHPPQGEQGRLARATVEAEQGQPEAERSAAGQHHRPRRDVAAQLGTARPASPPTIATSMPTHAQGEGSSPVATPSTTGTTTPSAAIGATTPIVPADSAE